MIKLLGMLKYLIGVFCFACLVFIGSACQPDTKTSQKTKAPQKKNVKKRNTTRKSPSLYWTKASKDLSLNKEQVSKIKAIHGKYKTQTNDLKKQNKWNDKESVEIESQKAKEIKALLGSDLYKKYDNFNQNWSKNKTAKPSPYWTKAQKEIPLSDKEASKIKAIHKKYKEKTNSFKKQKKWTTAVKSKLESQKAKEIKTLLGKKHDKYNKFNKEWQKANN